VEQIYKDGEVGKWRGKQICNGGVTGKDGVKQICRGDGGSGATQI
jgi:hypothetical protein